MSEQQKEPLDPQYDIGSVTGSPVSKEPSIDSTTVYSIQEGTAKILPKGSGTDSSAYEDGKPRRFKIRGKIIHD